MCVHPAPNSAGNLNERGADSYAARASATAERQSPLMLLAMPSRGPLWVIADAKAGIRDVRCTPKSGHAQRRDECRVSANSGHALSTVLAPPDDSRQLDLVH